MVAADTHEDTAYDNGKPRVSVGRKATGLPLRSQPGRRSNGAAMSGPVSILIMALRLAPLAAVLALAACGSSMHPATASASACDRVAARDGSDGNPGTVSSPFRTVQRLADSLQPGQTGCLRAGTYGEMTPGGYVLKFFHGGRSGAPISVQSYPGERAKLKGVVYFPANAPHVALRDVDIDGRARWLHSDTVTVQVMAADILFEGNDVTNDELKSCMIMGSNGGWGRAVDTVIRRNVFHRCGDPKHGMLDHGIYVENALRAEISDNVFWGAPGYAVHLYPNAQQTRVARNVMVDNGGGVIFAGEGRRASSGNVVERNVIAGSTGDFNIAQSWGGAVGTGNVARENCLYDGARGENIERQVGFAATDNTVANPRFSDPAAHDYRVAAGTACAKVLGDGIASSAGAVSAVGPRRKVARRAALTRRCVKRRSRAARKRCAAQARAARRVRG